MTDSTDSNFEPIANPYIVGNPIEDRRMFFGRQDDFAYIQKKVTGDKKGGMLVLCGTRRSGKTSILFQIKGGRLGEDFIPVLIDMQSMTVQSDGEFLAKLAAEIVTAIGDSDISYQRDFCAKADVNPFSAFQDLISKISMVLRGRKLILLFDEYELFETHIDKGRFSTDILNLFANWMEHKEGVFIVFTGSDKLEMRNSHCWESFLGKALHRRISFLSKTDTLRLINEPMRDVVHYDEGVAEEIYKLTAGQPFYTQVLCQSIVDHLNEMHKYDVTIEDVQEVVAEIIENPLPQMIFAWSSLSDLEKLSLSIIAELSKEEVRPVPFSSIYSFPSDENIGYELDDNKLHEAAERLFHHDLLNKDEQTDSYTFKMDLWRRWTTRMHSIWQVIDEIMSEGRDLEEGIAPVTKGKGFFSTRILALVVVVVVAVSAPLLYRSYQANKNLSSELATLGFMLDSTVVTINSEPSGAMVFLGDKRLGVTPLRNETVAAGREVLRVELAGYREFSDTLELLKDEPFDKSYALEEKRGNLKITSSPQGAAIYIDGSNTNLSTPNTIEGLSIKDIHSVRLKFQGYSDGYHQTVKVLEDSTVSLHHAFSKMMHRTTIITKPEQATIILDGKSIGISPQILDITQGSHRLELRREGYQPVSKSITIPATNNMVDIVMSELPPGKLIFEINPYAELWINGELIERDAVHKQIELKPGTYNIDLRHPHYGTRTYTIELKSGEVITRRYNLTEEEQQ